ncbi:MAG: TetR/AcrR family transcriptional regulator [Minicystis sp.]
MRATARILVREGYDRASTNKIALAAGVSIGSLYQYFPSKEALVAELLDRHCAEVIGVLAESAARYAYAPVPEAVQGAILAQVRAHRIDPALHRVLIEQVPRIGRLDQLAELDRKSAELVKGYLDAHRAELRVADTALAATFVVHTVKALTHIVVFDNEDTGDEARIVDEITDVVVRYLVKDPPRRTR